MERAFTPEESNDLLEELRGLYLYNMFSSTEERNHVSILLNEMIDRKQKELNEIKNTKEYHS